jgi:hypothetical protein
MLKFRVVLLSLGELVVKMHLKLAVLPMAVFLTLVRRQTIFAMSFIEWYV